MGPFVQVHLGMAAGGPPAGGKARPAFAGFCCIGGTCCVSGQLNTDPKTGNGTGPFVGAIAELNCWVCPEEAGLDSNVAVVVLLVLVAGPPMRPVKRDNGFGLAAYWRAKLLGDCVRPRSAPGDAPLSGA